MQNLLCTRFKSLRNTKPESVVNLVEVLLEIRSDKHREIVERIRSESNPSKSALKEKLPLFTPTGVFNHRSIAGLEDYNGIICLDLDDIENPEDLKAKSKEIPWVFSAFVTPSGRGLKVIVKTKSLKEDYKKYESSVAEEFLNATGKSRDNHCKDIARIQFVSYDPKIYINENSSTFQIS